MKLPYCCGCLVSSNRNLVGCVDASNVVLRARGLTAYYGSRVVVDGVSLALRAGQVVGLVGPNGCGKTTLLRALAGLLPASGILEYAGVPLADMDSRQRAGFRAFVAQESGDGFGFTVGDMVGLGGAHRSRVFWPPGGLALQKRVLAILEEVDLGPLVDRGCDELSGGERQRVVIARALLQGGRLLLLDEPTSALDLRHRALVLRALRRRASNGGAVIAAMHDLNLSIAACDRVLLMNNGVLVADGPPREVLTSKRVAQVYQTPVVQTPVVFAASPTIGEDSYAILIDPRSIQT